MATLKAGALLKGRYRLDRVIGEGAMGAVYSARDEHLVGATWALKILDEADLEPGEAAEAVALFQREADISARLRHPGLPEVVDFFHESGLHVLVMARIEGETLDAIVEQRGRPLEEAELIPLLIQLCACLSYLHRQRPHPVVFRDLKPSNCMVTRRGQMRLIDFGIARYYKPGRKSDTLVIGTPGFCAPEQYGHGQTEPRSDLYALGAMAWHLLSGCDPASVGFSFPPLRAVAPAASAEMEAIVARCLEFAPDGRYPSADALLADLRRVLPRTGAQAPAGRSPAPGGSVRNTRRLGRASALRVCPKPPPLPLSARSATSAPTPVCAPSPTCAPLVRSGGDAREAIIGLSFIVSWARRSFRVWWGQGSINLAWALVVLLATMVLVASAHVAFDPPRVQAVPNARTAPRGSVEACVESLQLLRDRLDGWQRIHGRFPEPGEAAFLDARPCPFTHAPFVYRVSSDKQRYTLECAGHPFGPHPRLDSRTRRITFTEDPP